MELVSSGENRDIDVILHVAIILIYFLFLTFSSTYLIYLRSLFT